jgi:hypothetical protein
LKCQEQSGANRLFLKSSSFGRIRFKGQKASSKFHLTLVPIGVKKSVILRNSDLQGLIATLDNAHYDVLNDTHLNVQ